MEFLQEINDVLNVAEVLEGNFIQVDVLPLREGRILWDRLNPLIDISENEFRSQYRLTKGAVLQLVSEIQEELQFRNNRGNPLTPLQQTSLALTFYASGTFMRTAGYLAGVKKSCACKTIHRVTTAICHLAQNVIHMPTIREMRSTSQKFLDKYGLPNFAMGVDGTHVHLGVRPCQNDLPVGVFVQDFWNRKQFYSINCQIMSNESHKILSISSQWAGSTHDSRVWSTSEGKHWLERQNEFMTAGIILSTVHI